MTDRKHSIECYDADCEWCSCWCHQEPSDDEEGGDDDA